MRTADRLGAQLRQARQTAGLTLREAADAVPCHRTTIARAEQGRAVPGPALLVRLAEVYTRAAYLAGRNVRSA